MEFQDNENTIILGGGLAGLSAGRRTGAPVYEADGEVGGVVRSKNVDGFIFDHGIHVLNSKDTYILNLLAYLSVIFQQQSRSAWIYSKGNYTPYPFQVNYGTFTTFYTHTMCIRFLKEEKTPYNI